MRMLACGTAAAGAGQPATAAALHIPPLARGPHPLTPPLLPPPCAAQLLPPMPPIKGCIPQKNFYPALKLFLRHPKFNHYSANLHWDNSTGTIDASFATLVHKAQPNGFSDLYKQQVRWIAGHVLGWGCAGGVSLGAGLSLRSLLPCAQPLP